MERLESEKVAMSKSVKEIRGEYETVNGKLGGIVGDLVILTCSMQAVKNVLVEKSKSGSEVRNKANVRKRI